MKIEKTKAFVKAYNYAMELINEAGAERLSALKAGATYAGIVPLSFIFSEKSSPELREFVEWANAIDRVA